MSPGVQLADWDLESLNHQSPPVAMDKEGCVHHQDLQETFHFGGGISHRRLKGLRD